MCGRYSLVPTIKLGERFNTINSIDIEPVYNVSPGFSMPVITNTNDTRLEIMKWGLIPHWAKNTQIGYKFINARGETVNVTSAFKVPFKYKRCLIPATGFYEWKKTDTAKIPNYFKLDNDGIFSFAGLYDVWVDAEGKETHSYTIITTTPNELMKPIHDRMPVILTPDKEQVWLNQNTEEKDLLKLLKPYDENNLETYPVSLAVNNARNQGDDLIKPVESAI